MDTQLLFLLCWLFSSPLHWSTVAAECSTHSLQQAGGDCTDSHTYCNPKAAVIKATKSVHNFTSNSFSPLLCHVAEAAVCTHTDHLPANAACSAHTFCESGICNNGACTTRPTKQPSTVGDWCWSTCWSNSLYCHVDATDVMNNNCRQYLTQGADCILGGTLCDTNSGLWCNAATATCAQQGTTAGAECDPSIAISCQAPLYCHATTKTCTEYIAIGQPCSTVDLCNPDSAECSTGLTSSLCRELREVGEDCTGDAGSGDTEKPCAQPLYCESGTNVCKAARQCATFGQDCSKLPVHLEKTVLCSCDDERVLVCNNGRWAWQYTLRPGQLASNVRACEYGLWLSPGLDRQCVISLECDTDADCQGDVSVNIAAEGHSGFQHFAYCGCNDNSPSTCKWAVTPSSCSADDQAKAEKRWCQNRKVVTPVAGTTTYDTFVAQSKLKADWEAAVQAAIWKCQLGVSIADAPNPTRLTVPNVDTTDPNQNGNPGGDLDNGDVDNDVDADGGHHHTDHGSDVDISLAVGSGGVYAVRTWNSNSVSTTAGAECSANPELVKSGDSCDEEHICDPREAKESTQTGEYGGTSLMVMSFLRCVQGICVQDYTLADGDDCVLDSSCKSGTCSVKKCKSPILRPDEAGDPCTTICFADNLYCKDGTCTEFAPKAPGQTCKLTSADPNELCEPPLYCHQPDNVCAVELADGTECTDADICKDGYCTKNNHCSQFRNEGQSCDGDSVVLNLQVCRPGFECKESRCREVVIPGREDCKKLGFMTNGEPCDQVLTPGVICGCHQSVKAWLVCNNNVWTRRWSIEDGINATHPQACAGGLWFDSRNNKCVATLGCAKDADCMSPMDPDAHNTQRISYCDCSLKKCKVIDGIDWTCTAIGGAELGEKACEVPTVGEGETELEVAESHARNVFAKTAFEVECLLGRVDSAHESAATYPVAHWWWSLLICVLLLPPLGWAE